MAIVLAGINGAGKTTASRKLLADRLAVMCFVNADMIARGLNAIVPESAALEAGQIMLHRLQELRTERADFAFETTLAGRSYLRFLRQLRQDGYGVELYYFWLRSADLAVTRVRTRVRAGGHNIPEETIRRRYGRSLENFWTAYRHEATRGSCTTTVVSHRPCSPRGTAGTTQSSLKPRLGKTSERRWTMRKDVSIEDRTKAIQEGVREALREHALLGRSVSIWRDGKIVWLTPAEILDELRRTEPPDASANGAAPGPP